MQWLMLQQAVPEDFVIATGIQHSVRQFVETAAAYLGISISWQGKGIHEQGVVDHVTPVKVPTRINGELQPGEPHVKPGDVIVAVDPMYFRPTEVETLMGDASKARKKLGWQPCIGFEEMVREMMFRDLEETRRETLCRGQGFACCSFEE
jgi:GDPmannose 4,6-dehydratase